MDSAILIISSSKEPPLPIKISPAFGIFFFKMQNDFIRCHCPLSFLNDPKLQIVLWVLIKSIKCLSTSSLLSSLIFSRLIGLFRVIILFVSILFASANSRLMDNDGNIILSILFNILEYSLLDFKKSE